MGKVIQFPIKNTETDSKQKTQVLQNRLDEIEIENEYINKDLDYLTNALTKNLDEASTILKEFAIINGENTPVMNEWGDDFEFTPDFEIKDEETMDKVVDSIADAAKKLEEAVFQLTLDLNINPDNEDK